MVQARNEELGHLYNSNGQSPCTMTRAMSTPCSTSDLQIGRAISARDDISSPAPSACTCNNVFFNMWSACLLTEGNTTLPLFNAWGAQCRTDSLNVTDGYSSKNNVEIPEWAFIAVTSDSKFDSATALEIAKPKPKWPTLAIVLPVITAVGTLAIAGIAYLLYRSKSSKKKRWPTEILHWLRPRYVPRVHKVRRANRSSTWSIDRTEEDEFVMVDHDDVGSHKSHSRLPSTETLEVMQASKPEPRGKTTWMNSPLAQQLRRLPDQFPIPFKDRAIQVQTLPPGRRFRVDPSGSSTESTRDSAISDPHSHYGTTEGYAQERPETIFETEEDVGPAARIHDDDEETSLISPEERSENHVFLITNRGGDFTLESGSSNTNSRSSHFVKVVPPTPTDSSRNSNIRPIIPPSQLAGPSRRPVFPPPPKQPAPLPPLSPPRIPPQLQRPSQETLRGSEAAPPIHVQAHPPPSNTPPAVLRRTPSPIPPDLPSTSHIPRQLSNDEGDPTKRNVLPARPMGARLPSSPRHINRQLSLDSEIDNLSQPVLSESEFRRYQLSPPPQIATPAPHRRGYSEDDSTSMLLPGTPRLTHGRNPSMESIIPSRGDPLMLFPGSVRAAGYTVALPSESESSVSLYSTTSMPGSSPGAVFPG
ncbi:hypothetical protein Hypma_004059 [Hypsizygus marmoreus]|uniref:Uncharacterized protein n=1 Tax=Hypsizygus marmoreus TaxID=39966 RepID=A0A369J826_HYPMA|nr:hypothetical protein Hypma_004059 [Hypsizygus marmoreus]